MLADLSYQTGDMPEAGSGNVLTHLVGRTVASGDAIHSNAVFVINDSAWTLKRPQDYPRAEIAELVQLARERQFGALCQRSRVHIADRRVDVPRIPPWTPRFNK